MNHRRLRLLTLLPLLSAPIAACGASSSDPANPPVGSAGAAHAGRGGGDASSRAGTSNGGHAGHAGSTPVKDSDGGASGGDTTGSAGAGGDSDASAGMAGEDDGKAGAAHGGSGGASAGAGGALHGGSGGVAGATGGSSGQAGSAGSSGQAGSAGLRDHCIDGYAPDPSDATTTMLDGPVEYTKSNQVDLTVQPEVLAWFQARVWEQAHFQWYNIRRCTSGGATADPQGGGINPCVTHAELVPLNQEGKGPGNGLEYLAMNRHLIQSMKQLWPHHAEQFEGWEHFPTQATDVPAEWQAAWSAWPANIATAGAKADDPASHLAEAGFESEGAFGQWIQTTSGLHGALHFKWVRTNNSEHGLGNQFVTIDNYLFWKVHGWIDKAWDRYRAAKGKTPNDPDIKDAVRAQCRQLDALSVMVKPSLGNP